MKYLYPALFTRELTGQINVTFPDLPRVYVSGQDIADALSLAQNSLTDYLSSVNDIQDTLPLPTDPFLIPHNDNQLVVLITANSKASHHLVANQQVQITVTIPKYLDDQAITEHIDLSSVLTAALKTKLNVH
ncbi:type II toxin-antitoxin system HicB family antitoxin [Levilactobacillus fujinensis]|uniref:Type II toxin-antitoxin system HicB family antitoxin n=1 Tax=Levilactobacillus fujinensis TaxID=2486024 RepID=A0ABW1TF10_9LACO|nr:type II toxin-antitoxin system HicB family antitoxin [Levilactobacillus fujinensis]